jgi:SOS-response transcriptional repressor LexA
MDRMNTDACMVQDDGGSRVVYAQQPGTWRFVVKTNAWRKEGIFPEDVLVVQEVSQVHNGDWAILNFDGKSIVRQVELLEGVVRFKPLDATLQPIDWPLHKELPVVGVVKSIIRNRSKTA